MKTSDNTNNSGKSQSVWEIVIRIIIAVASALAGALGMQTLG